MQIGMVGLGRMGGNMAERLRRGGHEVVGYDRDPAISDVEDLKELVERLRPPRAVWVMVPAGEPTRATVEALAGLLAPGDIVIDGGNSHYVDDRRHGDELAAKGIGFVDVGVSGGVWGLDNGYALMTGGDEAHIRALSPVFDTLKPAEGGFVHAGKIGAGHFAKMVHNGIEYGMMQAFAEGWELLEAADVVDDVEGTFKSWRQGTVIRSWLLDLMVRALDEDPDLSELRGYAQDSGEGRWTVQAAVEHAVPLPVITAALYARFRSRQSDSPAMKVIAALRSQFGGHAVSSAEGSEGLGADSPGADVAPPA
ncbi:decarboxylating 6-phosphogluconate dehydrogenase [Spongiactinospora rosea]|uniref:Decarboxylating 6-phosphogluconate dehydrogenase n=1 Tax=Spongiactinospora rosea TaxID=2248750 RepID=A0A366LWI4_9ACTN|nr:decarboxylating 6-phosphogluconate dehydrogenase [Spongiactinospora rosea]RBQ18117.1 decarboxylating 6-phosphogluconate dehydrogenase [Spongiactinospora rosea]